ncbi:MAG: zinc-binding alcohol dehydrogenase [Pseudomonadota bacterium]
MSDRADALVYTAPGQAQIQAINLPAMASGMVEVETLFSGVSRGTERLVFEGRVPESEWQRMRAPFQTGDFPFPVRYGYASVGRVIQGPDRVMGQTVFCLHPHQTRFRVPVDAIVPVPARVPASRAVLAANMETALNAVWDADPKPGSRCLVVGAGLVGALIALILAQWEDLSVAVTDKRALSVVKWADVDVNSVTPDAVPQGSFDIAFHTSASAKGLETALDALAFEGRVIELSWYGDHAVPVPLGGSFHANRLQIISSQVGHVAARRRASTSHSERLMRALSMLDDPILDALITNQVAFHDLPDRLPDLLAPDADGIATRVSFS